MAKRNLSRQEKKNINQRNKDRIRKKRAIKIRKVLDKMTLREKSDTSITLAVLGLILFGTFMIISTNVGQTTKDSTVVLSTLIKQCIFLAGAFFCMWGSNRIFSFRWFSNCDILAILGMGVFMIMPLAFAAEKGSQAWIRIGSITIQPSEFAKPFIIVLIANALYVAKRNKEMTKNWYALFKRPFFALCLIIVIMILQRDLGTLGIIMMIFFVCILIPDYPRIKRFQILLKRLFMGVVVAVVVLFGVTDIGVKVIAMSPFGHIATRIENAKNPYTDIYGEGYQPANSLYGIASSNIIGKGVGASDRKYGYLTQADNDYILAVTIEETGIIGLGIIVSLYALIIYKLFFYAFKTKEVVYKIMLVGTSTYLFMHFFLNVGGVAGLIPFTGVPLLFISSGGSSLIAICVAIGLCQQCISQIRILEIGDKV